METKWLQTFVVTAQRRSMSAAALELGYARSTVTGHIQQLEREIGVELFARGGSHHGLTASGTELLHYAIEVLDTLERGTARARQAVSHQAVLRVGATEFGCAYHLPPFMRQIKSVARDARFAVTADHSRALEQRLQHGELDLALVPQTVPGRRVTDDGGVRGVLVRIEPFVLVRSSAPTANTTTVLVAAKGDVSRDAVERDLLVRDSGYETLEMGSLEAVKAAASSGLGVGVVPLMMARAALAAGSLTQIPWRSGIACHLRLMWNPRSCPPEVNQLFDRIAAQIEKGATGPEDADLNSGRRAVPAKS